MWSQCIFALGQQLDALDTDIKVAALYAIEDSRVLREIRMLTTLITLEAISVCFHFLSVLYHEFRHLIESGVD